MRHENLQKITRNGLLVLGLAVATVLPVAAQSNNVNNNNVRNDRNDNTTTTRVVERDNDTDWGWLGLLGLLGLAGLIPKKTRQVEVQQFRDVRTDQTTGQSNTGTGTGAAH